ncbi:MAG: asparagine synthase-related protein [Actinomycetota bacterium]|nr:asparagine synthase-related protein [Actinomycetota bacterium]
MRVDEMCEALVHRGPDDHGEQSVGAGRTLAHRRLSIVDLEHGRQPFVAADADRVLVANGEIYNAPELRAELGAERFVSQSDNEVILHIVDQRGADGLGDLRGMFAFALASGDELLLGRDPLGIKPLYVGDSADGLVFASELKAFPAGTTGVRSVAPGTTFSTRDGVASHWDIPAPQAGTTPFEIAAKEVREVLDRAVTRRLMADVPVGAFLSGGLDSSAICALIRQHVDELHTFSVGLEGSPDLIAARRVAEHLGTIHHEHVLTEAEIVAALPEIVASLESFDQDLVRSAAPTWFVAELAARHVKVVLTGEGADELFSGYAYHGDFTDPWALDAESRRSLGELHHVNLQRVDRMTMAHSLEARVPFLDVELIDTVLRIDPEHKLPTVGGLEKALLRTAVEDLLPHEIVWRKKAQFDEGSGTADLLGTLRSMAEGLDVDAYRAAHPDAALRSAEECRYHQLLVDGVAHPDVVLPNVARWASGRVDAN